MSLTLTKVINGIVLEVKSSSTHRPELLQMVELPDLLLIGQDRVCTITNVITNILEQVEVTVVGNNKSVPWEVDAHLSTFILILLRHCE